jgi:recombinational DNA repair protein (RecF pathway)
MQEYFTEALVLDKEELGERDFKLCLYTRELGKVIAKIKSSRNILSKLNGHLEPFNLVDIRLVGRGLQIVDALLIEKTKSSWLLNDFLNFIKETTLEGQSDEQFWVLLKQTIASGQPDYKKFLILQGFDPKHALCQNCQQPQPQCFFYQNQSFFCKNCAFNFINLCSNGFLELF